MLTFDEALDETSQPATSAYAVSVSGGTPSAPATVSVSGSTVTLTLSSAPTEGASVRLSYTPGTSPVQDLEGNDAPAFTARELSSAGKLRLVGGAAAHEGRLEIFYSGAWGTVCDDFWTRPDADVACRSLGYPGGSVNELFRKAHFGQGAGNIVLDDLRCTGKEANLLECSSRAVGTHNCEHSEDVGLRCVTQTAPWVIGIEANDPPGGSFNAGETLTVTLEWNEPVNVVVPAGGRKPKVWASFGTSKVVVPVEYASGTGTTQTVLEHTFASDDFWDGSTAFSGTRVHRSSLTLHDGTIRSVSSTLDALLEHRGYPDDSGGLLRVVAPTVLGTPSVRRGMGGRSRESGVGNTVSNAVERPESEDGAWSSGDTIEVALTFSEPVVVDTTGGTPSIGLVLGGATARSAGYVRGTGTVELVFGYTVVDADGTPTSILVTANSLALNGGAIRSRTSGLDAVLSHGGAQGRSSPETPEPATGFSAEFRSLPSSHDGSSAFAFELHFSEAPDTLSYATVQGGLLDVTGANVTHARRLTPGSDIGWEVTAQPTQSGNITISLPVRACDAANAVCASSRPLAQAASATVRARPLTASFENPPAEHDGTNAFEIRFDLSEEPAPLSYRTVRDALFTVTGGSNTNASRLEPGKSRSWKLTVQPSGNGDVTLSMNPTTACDALPGVCTSDGRMLGSGLRILIAGPAALSVADAEVEEAEGATLDFAVTLSRRRISETTVDYATSDGTATQPGDYTSTSGTLIFAAGETSKTVTVPVIDDAHDEGSETMTLTLSNASGALLGDASATGTISNNDPMPKAWMTRFGRTIGNQVVEALGERFTGDHGSHVTLGGLRFDAAALIEPSANAEAFERRDATQTLHTLTMDDLIRHGSFHLSTDNARSAGARLSAWGRVAHDGFEADVDGVTLDGDVTSAFFGADAEWDEVLAGVALSRSSGEGDYALSETLGDDEGSVESTLTGVYPYGRFDVTERIAVWGALGMGSGDITLERAQGERLETDLSMRMGAVGLSAGLIEGEDAFTLRLRSDALWVAMESDATTGLIATEGETTRLRVTLDAERAFALGESALLTPSAQLGLRLDGGDAETGAGAELGAGLRYTTGRLSVEGRARTLIAHQESGYEEWGVSGALRFESRASGRGLSLSLSPAWGSTGSAAEALWGARDASVLGFNGKFQGRGRLESEIGYGLALSHRRGLLTPYTALALSGDGASALRTGARWTLSPEATLALEGERSTASALTLRGELRF